MSDVITHAGQVTLDWLNTALSGTAALTEGRVSHFELAESDSINAQMIHLRLRYTTDAQGTLPAALLLKLCQDEDFGDSEVHYYMRDYVDLADAPLVRCYHARYAASPSRYHLLLDDLSATHRNNYDTPPTLDYGLQVARALAKLHVHWWSPAKREKLGAMIPTDAAIRRSIGPAAAGLEPMLSRVREEIDPTWRDILYEIFRMHPRCMIERTRNPNGFTLVHGDVNPGNVLSPIDGTGKIYLIDRQPFEESLTVWLGVSDLAYLIVRPWQTNLRRAAELPILREYHDNLMQAGITDYDWDQLLDDYRLSVIQSVYVSAARCEEAAECDQMQWLWWPHLQRSMTAYFDLDCDRILETTRPQ